MTEKGEKYNQESHRCKHPKHPTTFVNKYNRCSKSWKCPHYKDKECIAE